MDTLAVGTLVTAGDARRDCLVVTGKFALVPDGARGTGHLLRAVRGTLDELPAVRWVREVLLSAGAVHTGEGGPGVVGGLACGRCCGSSYIGG